MTATDSTGEFSFGVAGEGVSVDPTGLLHIPTDALRDGITVTATTAGGTSRFRVSMLAEVAAPAVIGTLPDVSYVQGSGVKTVAAAAAFSGADLRYAVTGPEGVAIDAGGVVSIPTTALMAAAEITVTATNPGGSAATGFKVTVAAAVVAPSPVGAIADQSYDKDSGAKAVATAANFAGTTPFTFSLDAAPAGVSIDAAGVVTIPTASLFNALVTVRAANAAGAATQSFKVTVAAAVVAPSPVGAIADASYTQNSGVKTVATAASFAGTTPFTFSLAAAPSGVTIDAATGEVSIPTATLISGQTVTVRAANGAGSAAQSFKVTVAAASRAPAFPAAALDVAIDKAFNAYKDDATGIATGGFHGCACVCIAYAAWTGDSSVDTRLKNEMISWLSAKGPTCQGGVSGKFDQYAMATIAIAKNTPRVWNSLTDAQRKGLTALIEAGCVAGAAIWAGSYSNAAKNLRGAPSNRGGNPNIQSSFPGLMAAYRIFAGSDAAMTSFLNNVDIADLRGRLNAAGCSLAAKTLASSRPEGAPSIAEIASSCRNWKSFKNGSDTIADLWGSILTQQVNFNVNRTIMSGYGGNAGNDWIGPGIDGRAKMINDPRSLLNRGTANGMCNEMESADAEGVRASPSYCMHALQVVTIWLLCGIVGGTLDRAGPGIQAAKNRLHLGWQTQRTFGEKGYYGYAHSGGTHSETWTEDSHAGPWGWVYRYAMWFDVVKPWLDA
jgi:hypothetical protein